MSKETSTSDIITRYLVVAAGLLGLFMLAAALYEMLVNVSDSRADTWLEIVKWTGPALGTTTIILIYWEVFNMIMRKIYVDKARRDRDLEWVEWNRKRDQAREEGREFNEPSPAEKEVESKR